MTPRVGGFGCSVCLNALGGGGDEWLGTRIMGPRKTEKMLKRGVKDENVGQKIELVSK